MGKSKKAAKPKAIKLKASLPGMQIQREDAVRHATVIDRGGYRANLPRQPQRRPAPRVTGGQKLSRTEVWTKLESAMKTLRAMPDKERRFFVVKCGWPDFAHDYMDAYAAVDAIVPRYQPTPQEVSEYLDVLAWMRHLERRDWQLLWWRSFENVSFGTIAKYIGRSDETARKRFENALTDVWVAANGIQIPLGKVGKSG